MISECWPTYCSNYWYYWSFLVCRRGCCGSCKFVMTYVLACRCVVHHCYNGRPRFWNGSTLGTQTYSRSLGSVSSVYLWNRMAFSSLKEKVYGKYKWDINWEYVYSYLVKHTTQGVTWTWKLELLVGPPLHPCHSYDVLSVVPFPFLFRRPCCGFWFHLVSVFVSFSAVSLLRLLFYGEPFPWPYALSFRNLSLAVFPFWLWISMIQFWCSSVGGTLPINRDIATVIVYMEKHWGKGRV